MDPLRRLILLALLASVVMAEPSHARALTAAVIADAATVPVDARPTLAPGGWAKRIATLLRKTIRPAATDNAGPRRRRSITDVARRLIGAAAQVGRPLPTLDVRCFRLPPPLLG